MEKIGTYIGMAFLLVQLAAMIAGFCRKRYGLPLGTAIASIAVNIVLFLYYNGLPGKGEAPGLTYLGETIFQMGFVLIGGLLLVILLLVMRFSKRK